MIPWIFWKYVDTSLNVKNGISNIALGNGNTAETDEKTLHALNLFFSFVFQNEILDNISALFCAKNYDGLCFPDVFISPAAVFSKPRKLNPTKSEGRYRIHPRVLLELHKFHYIPLTILFNNSMEKGCIPCDWKNAEIIAIFKKTLRVIQQAIDQ